jgi:hypothetical protein
VGNLESEDARIGKSEEGREDDDEKEEVPGKVVADG